MDNNKIKYCHIFLTNQCNFNCPSCFVSAGKKLKKELKTEEWEKVINELADFKIRSMHIEGGEPFMREDIFFLLRKIAEKFKNAEVVTNASFINNKQIEKLKKTGLKKIVVSLDGATENTYSKVRGQYFKKTMENIEKLSKFFKVQITFTLMKHNFKEMNKVISIGKKFGVDSISFVSLDIIGRACNNPIFWLNKDDYKKIIKKYFKNIKKYVEKDNSSKKIKIRLNLPGYLINEAKKYENNYSKIIHILCDAAVNQIAINPVGVVTPCYILDYQKKENNVKNKSIKEILRSDSFNKFKKMPLGKKCKLCYKGHLFIRSY